LPFTFSSPQEAIDAVGIEAEAVGADTVQTTLRVTIEVEGGDKPACVADVITRSRFQNRHRP